MNLLGWAPIGQLGLSAATAAVAFAVYRAQAGKLFLEMRDNRITAIDRYRDAINARLKEVTDINRVTIESELTPEKIQTLMAEQWDAERGIRRWFGAEMIPLMHATDSAILDAAQAKIRWCSAEPGQAGSYQKVNDLHLAALRMLESTLEAANPYIRAGRRGLPMTASWHIWRSRRLRRRGAEISVTARRTSRR